MFHIDLLRTITMPGRIPAMLDMTTVALYSTIAQAGGQAPIYTTPWEGVIGLLVGGIGFAIYWVTKTVLEIKYRQGTISHSSEIGSPILWQKMQEVLDAQRVNQEHILQALLKINDNLEGLQLLMAGHDAYVREHVGLRGAEISRELGGAIAPLVVNAIRGAFEDNRVRVLSAQPTAKFPKIKRAKKKTPK